MLGIRAGLAPNRMRNQSGKNDEQDTFMLLPRYFACYGILVVIVAIMTWLMLQLRTVIVEVGLALGLSSWTMTVVDQFGFILLGIVWLIAFFVIEAYLRHGVPTKLLWPRAVKIVLWEFVLIFVVFAALQILS
jgi:hypothetical protein